MYRVYWVAQGVNWDRPGGPWWYKDFYTSDERDRFIKGLGPFAECIKTLDDTPYHHPMKIVPPPEAVTVK